MLAAVVSKRSAARTIAKALAAAVLYFLRTFLAGKSLGRSADSKILQLLAALDRRHQTPRLRRQFRRNSRPAVERIGA
jgi:hypothetical protein